VVKDYRFKISDVIFLIFVSKNWSKDKRSIIQS
jgi:hypothetical protein